ncbi:GNAT family N-acetyltransferase [Actinopolymorpha singaporensis]|uniref:Acetyltransferase (GNAT) domain-containing protein n=1 Tax=Actinopolymorpha singaporensis TaxID=117157 RepID=A0A1H1LNP1_9ACTN|nr:GNAT family N-acetyltransferase [Actinopolymorpha singaporensis]SDR75912.1 Acetyltransferase (GNAT) domain-containing protein [Actinopolymorpha singaporensis]
MTSTANRSATSGAQTSVAAELLAAHDAQVRATVAARMPLTWTSHPDGRVLRVTTTHRAFVFSDGLAGASDEEVEGYVRRARDFFAERNEAVEWKYYSNDHPRLRGLLEEAGFAPEDEESVVVGRVRDVLDAGRVPEGITIRPVSDRPDLDRIAAMESEVWSQDWSWLADDLADRVAGSPDDIAVLVAEADGAVVAAAWLVVMPGTRFGGLWGGSTLARWRGRGIYRALIAERARIAQAKGLEFLQVDASEDSRPILERLGMFKVATTTPYVWTPQAS